MFTANQRRVGAALLSLALVAPPPGRQAPKSNTTPGTPIAGMQSDD